MNYKSNWNYQKTEKGGFKFKPKNRWYIKPGIIKVKVGKPISQNEYLSLGVDGLLKKTHQQMKKMLEVTKI